MTETDDKKPTCGDAGGRTKDGTLCGIHLNLSPGSGLCLHHDPARSDEQLAVVTAGGHAAHAARLADPDDVPPKPETLQDATEYAAWCLHAMTCGRLGHREGRDVLYGLRCYKDLAEKRDLEREVVALRGELKALKRPGSGRPRLA